MGTPEPASGWRVAIISSVLPVVERLVPYLRELGHEPIAWLLARRADDWPTPPWGEITDRNAPAGMNVLLAADSGLSHRCCAASSRT